MGRILAAAIAAGALVCAGWAQETVFRVNVRLVRLLVTVKDLAGSPVGSLEKSDFRVFDNGVEQEISHFERHTEQPLSVALLIDTSGSTAKELRYELDSVSKFLRAFLREGHPEDAVSLYTFDTFVTLRTSFTRRLGLLEQGYRQLKPEGGTSLYDAIYLAAGRLEDRDGRRVLVVITDGGDTTSAKNFHDALEAAHRADAALYGILVMPITNDAGRNIGGENALSGLATGTGGRVFTPSVGPTLDLAFEEILKDLRTQYLLGYYPRNVPPTRNRFHRLEVKLRHPDLRPLARTGYYGESEAVSGRQE